jgi:hypothetical protein
MTNVQNPTNANLFRHLNIGHSDIDSNFEFRHSNFTPILLLIVVLAAALRIPGLFTNFWWDEIWSWSIAGQLHSVAGVLLAEVAHIDNNHPLNTLWLYLMGQRQPVWVYRLPALIAGVGSVALAARLMLRIGKLEAGIAALLIALSYPLIFYSSEARGYSLVIFFSFLSFDLVQRSLQAPSQKSYGIECLFGISAVLGFLSHLMFVNAYTAALVWSWVRVRELETTTGARLTRLARLHTIPAIGVLLLFHYFVRGMVDGGAPPTSPRAVVLQSLSMTVGGPGSGGFACITAAIAISLFAGALIYLKKAKSAIWVFFIVAVVVAPAMMCTRALYFNARPQPLMLRYFLISIAMILESTCPMLAYIWRRSSIGRTALKMCLCLYAMGNLIHLCAFLAVGRGHYEEALTEIANQAHGKTIALSSDNPTHIDLILQFYGPRVSQTHQFTVDTDPHEWLILNRIGSNEQPTLDYSGRQYFLVRVWPSTNLSGWGWHVFRESKDFR